MKILVFDNYDSFTYNLVHLVEKITHEKVDVYRNDQIPLEKIKEYDKIILSPGPGIPSEAGLLLDVIREYAPTKSILGVCLGHQAIGEVFGGELENLSSVFHGVATPCTLATDNILFKGFPEQLEITAWDENNYIMGLQHKKYDVKGVQFHPESVLTPDGEVIMRNWLAV